MPTTKNTTPTPRAPITPTLYTMPSPAALSAEAKAEGAGESVVLALCEVCHQPTADSVIKQYNQVIEELHADSAYKSQKINSLTADKAALQTRVERLEDELEQCQRNHYIASPDGGLPLWLPAAICMGFGVIGWLAAYHAMPLIAALWGF